MRKIKIFLSVGLLMLSLFIGQSLPAADFKSNNLDPTYDHTKYAPNCNHDILRQFTAYSTCFDGDDDDDGDGKSDKWAIPEWVAYEIKAYPGKLPKGPKRPSEWITDIDLYNKGIASKDNSYAFSAAHRKAHPDSPQLGYDRGHMCMKEIAWRLGADADWNTHTVLNACPQKSYLNQGIWLDLEEKTEKWADEFGAVWVITGPIVFNKKVSRWLGEEGEVPVAIPDAFFKIVVREADGHPQVLAFIYPQEGIGYKAKGGYDQVPYLTSVDIIEALIGLDFFPTLPEKEQVEIERIIQVRLWD
jgi:endonuclease G, mitochondrial